MATFKQERPLTLWAPESITTAAARDQWAVTEEARLAAIQQAAGWPAVVAVHSCRLDTTGANHYNGRQFAFFRVVVECIDLQAQDADQVHPVVRGGKLD